MIFVDETGKRWKLLKRSALLSGLAVVVPVGALAIGSYLFNPGWSALNLKPLHTSTPGASDVQTAIDGLQPQGTNNLLARATSSALSTHAVLGVSTNIPSTTSNGSTVTSLSTSTTGSGTTSTSNGAPQSGLSNPGNKDYGTAHNPKK